MTKESKNDRGAKPASPPLALQKAEKGSQRSMWEILLEMRVLLPYLARLAPLLDRGSSKASPGPSPDLGELKEGIAEMQTGRRDLEVQARNQALQLERIEQQMGRLRVVHENSIEESRRLYADMRSLRRLLLTLAGVMVLLLLVTVGMVAYLLFRPVG